MMENPSASWQRDRLLAGFPDLWSGMLAEWRQPGTQDRAWLMYSANYLFRTQDVRWAIDPLRLSQRLSQAQPVSMAQGLQALSFVLLTHRHKDHLDLGLIRELRDLPIRWVVPEDLLPLIETQSELPLQRVIVPEHGKAFELEGLRITPFDGLHWEPAGTLREDGQAALRGVPATGYLVECGSKRWLFPGDTRRYEAQRLPSFGPVDVLFAHVWLGRAGALEAQPPLLEPFCRFCLDLQPRHILLTHLHEFGRAPEDYWDEEHAARALSRLGELAPDLPVQTLVTGQGVTL